MKLKYYLRGLGIGIIVTTIVLAIVFSKNKKVMSDDEVIERATQLGMIMPEDSAEETEVMDAEGLLASVTSERGQDHADTKDGSQSSEDAKDTQDGGNPENTENVQDSQSPEDADAERDSGGSDTPAEAEGGQAPEDDRNPEDEQNPEDAGGADAGAQTESYHLVIKRGDVCRTVCETLAANGVTSDAEALRKYLFEIGYASSISVGEYDIPYGSSMEEIAALLKAGPTER